MADMSQTVEQGYASEGGKVIVNADEAKLNDIGYAQEFKRDMSAVGSVWRGWPPLS
jgi:hypothetical protein